jgi:hypothetical protein
MEVPGAVVAKETFSVSSAQTEKSQAGMLAVLFSIRCRLNQARNVMPQVYRKTNRIYRDPAGSDNLHSFML